jgi:hypothetical protein
VDGDRRSHAPLGLFILSCVPARQLTVGRAARVRVGVGVSVPVSVGVGENVRVIVGFLSVTVGVRVDVCEGVIVADGMSVAVGVFVGDSVNVADGMSVEVSDGNGVNVAGVIAGGLDVMLCISVGICVRVGALVNLTVGV